MPIQPCPKPALAEPYHTHNKLPQQPLARTSLAGRREAMVLTIRSSLGQQLEASLECTSDTLGRLSPCGHTAICTSNEPSRGVQKPAGDTSRGHLPCVHHPQWRRITSLMVKW